MANNRMFLLHQPSGVAVYLGKRMATGWYDTPKCVGDRIKALFEQVELENVATDDFCLAMEDASAAPMVVEYRKISEADGNGLVKLEVNNG